MGQNMAYVDEKIGKFDHFVGVCPSHYRSMLCPWAVIRRAHRRRGPCHEHLITMSHHLSLPMKNEGEPYVKCCQGHTSLHCQARPSWRHRRPQIVGLGIDVEREREKKWLWVDNSVDYGVLYGKIKEHSHVREHARWTWGFVKKNVGSVCHTSCPHLVSARFIIDGACWTSLEC